MKRLAFFFLISLLMLTSLGLQAQGEQHVSDSVRRVKREVKRLLNRKMKENIEAYRESRAVSTQRQRLSSLKRYSTKIDAYFKRGLDTTGVFEKTIKLEKEFYDIVTSSTQQHEPFFLSYRNLTTAEMLLKELLVQVRGEQSKMRHYLDEMQIMQLELDSLIMDTSIYVIPLDNQKFELVMESLTSVNKKIKPMDSLLQATINVVLEMDVKLSGLYTRMESELHQVQYQRGKLASVLLHRELPSLWQRFETDKGIGDIIKPSIERAQQALYYLVINNRDKLQLSLILYGLASAFVFWCVRTIRARGKAVDATNELAFRHPFIAVSLVFFSITQFLFFNPPAVFQLIIWLISAILMTLMLGGKMKFFRNQLLLGIVFFLIPVILINLLLEPTNIERWLIFMLALFAIFYSFFLWRLRAHYNMSQRLFKVMFLLFIGCEISSLISVSFGRFNFARTLLTAGYFTFLSALFMVWAEHLFNKIIGLIADAYDTFEHQNIRLKVLSFQQRIKNYVHVLVYIGIAILFLRNFYLYDVISSWMGEFFTLERVIGNSTFTWYNILTFVVVIVISTTISGFVAFLFDDSLVVNRERGKGGLKNWALLIRLCIIIFGFLTAFAAAGISMDKLTIIIGALGIGIGFGLQTIVNNLFSGIILAFERPIEIGDQIEVAGRIGRVNAIGIRSSKLQSFDGSEVIIPNGDLLSQHVVNWTLSNNHRRVELLIGVKYGMDLNIVKKILEEVIQTNERVERYPLQQVLLKNFDDSAITFQLFFWTDIRYWMDVKSEIILAIDKAFKEKGVEIPYPQLEVHLQTKVAEEKPSDKAE